MGWCLRRLGSTATSLIDHFTKSPRTCTSVSDVLLILINFSWSFLLTSDSLMIRSDFGYVVPCSVMTEDRPTLCRLALIIIMDDQSGYTEYDRLERSLLDPNSIFFGEQSSFSQERKVHQSRRFVDQALCQQKHSNKQAVSAQKSLERRLLVMDRKRRHLLLQGIKYRNKLEKLSDVQQMSTILLMERELKRRNDMQELNKKREQYFEKRMSNEQRMELSKRLFHQKKLQELEKRKLEELQLEMEKQKLNEMAMNERVSRAEQRRSEQVRQRSRMKRYQAFKTARAMDNYNEKVIRVLEEQKAQSDTIRQLYSQETEQKEIMKRTQKLGRSTNMVQRILEGRTFELTTL